MSNIIAYVFVTSCVGKGAGGKFFFHKELRSATISKERNFIEIAIGVFPAYEENREDEAFQTNCEKAGKIICQMTEDELENVSEPSLLKFVNDNKDKLEKQSGNESSCSANLVPYHLNADISLYYDESEAFFVVEETSDVLDTCNIEKRNALIKAKIKEIRKDASISIYFFLHRSTQFDYEKKIINEQIANIFFFSHTSAFEEYKFLTKRITEEQFREYVKKRITSKALDVLEREQEKLANLCAITVLDGLGIDADEHISKLSRTQYLSLLTELYFYHHE